MSVTFMVPGERVTEAANPLEDLAGSQLLAHIVHNGGVDIGMGCTGADGEAGGRLVGSILDRLGILRNVVRIDVGQYEDNPDRLVASIRLV